MDGKQTAYINNNHRVTKAKGMSLRRKISALLLGLTLISSILLVPDIRDKANILNYHLLHSSPLGGIIADKDWNLILVNSSHPIPSYFPVDLTTLKHGYQVDDRIYTHLQQMFDDARACGVFPMVASGYRTSERQAALLNSKINEYRADGYNQTDAEEKARTWVAAPGTSEHQTGLAVDIVAEDNQKLDESQKKSKVQKWLIANCYKYGFILRYSADKTNITGINYEPWHYRYVGVEAATQMHKQGLCLEEYLEQRK